MAKLAPNTERLAGSVAPKSNQIKAHLGKARFVHQKANVYNKVIEYIQVLTRLSVEYQVELHLIGVVKFGSG